MEQTDHSRTPRQRAGGGTPRTQKRTPGAKKADRVESGSQKTSPRGISKRFLKTRPACRVTFRIPPEEGGTAAAVAGDFSAWRPVPMRSLRKGGFSHTVELATGASYEFRYILDGRRWCNDWEADGYVRNRFGGDNCLIHL